MSSDNFTITIICIICFLIWFLLFSHRNSDWNTMLEMSHTMLMVKILNTHPAKVHKNAMIYFPLYIHSKYATYSLSKFTILILLFFYQQMLHEVFLWSCIGSWFHRIKIKQEIIHRNVKTRICNVWFVVFTFHILILFTQVL